MITHVLVALLVVAGLIALAACIAIPAAWIALGCYPWRRCGKCGWTEWRIFRRRP